MYFTRYTRYRLNDEIHRDPQPHPGSFHHQLGFQTVDWEPESAFRPHSRTLPPRRVTIVDKPNDMRVRPYVLTVAVRSLTTAQSIAYCTAGPKSCGASGARSWSRACRPPAHVRDVSIRSGFEICMKSCQTLKQGRTKAIDQEENRGQERRGRGRVPHCCALLARSSHPGSRAGGRVARAPASVPGRARVRGAVCRALTATGVLGGKPMV